MTDATLAVTGTPTQSVASGERNSASKPQQVYAALQNALDPELDQSVVELGFVSKVEVNDDIATIAFRLPTFWCSANFAWIMAEDMRLALGALPWLRRADLRLFDHFASDRINEGIARGQSFRETFAGEAAGDLADLRATFRRKAFLGRMSALIEALRELLWSDEQIVTTRIDDLLEIGDQASLKPLVDRYLELRAFFGGASEAGDAAFRTANGDPINAAELPAYLRDIRMTRRGVEANGEMCRILLAERYGGRAPDEAAAMSSP